MVTASRAPFAWLFACCLSSSLACSSPAEQTEGGTAGTGGGASNSGGTAGAAAGGSAAAAGSGGDVRGGAAGSSAGGSPDPGGAGGGGSGAGGEGNFTGEYGFAFRKPGTDNLDLLCTFHDGDEPAYVYVRLVQTGTLPVLGMPPIYSVQLAQISLSGVVSDLAGAQYDYGGGHHNDALSFEYAGKTQRYYHSSFGFGFRRCQNMDCRNVYALGTTTLETEGCASDRKLPEACVSIESDGTHAPLVDSFMKCPGDTQ
jgi:hypothetical protein